MIRCNAVFEGGGVKGIGLVGAIQALEEHDYQFAGLAGTSAGAIVAALLAAGYTAPEMREILSETNYLQFKDKGFLDYLGFPGKALSFLINYGIYSSKYFEQWLTEILARKNVRTFGDIPADPGINPLQPYRFQAIAADITTRSLLTLPDDLADFGIDIDQFSVAKAVRMSMSIPFFFEPVALKDAFGRKHLIVDGGLLSNYPLWLFDNAPKNTCTLGIRFKERCSTQLKNLTPNPIGNILDYFKHLFETMMDFHDKQYVASAANYSRTIYISPTVEIDGRLQDIGATKFNITKSEADALFQNGYDAASQFFRRGRVHAQNVRAYHLSPAQD